MFKNLFKKSDICLKSPLEGEFLLINKVKDPVFSQEMLGKGIAVEPTNEIVTAPADATVLQVFDTKHAIVLDVAGAEVLIHVGLDTVKMGGEGFVAFVQQGDKVKEGDKLLQFSAEAIKAANHPLTTVMVVCNSDQYSEFKVHEENSSVDSTSSVITLVR